MTYGNEAHPAATVRGRALWFGPEVEGRYARTRMPTAFVGAELSDDERRELLLSGVEQVYFTESFDAWDWYETYLQHALRKLAVAVTVARFPPQVEAFLARAWAREVKLVVHVLDAPWVHKLRAGDEVSLGVPYHVWSFGLEDGIETRPGDYEEDASDVPGG